MNFRFLSVQKVPKHKQFKYNPRFYDPKKEELNRRVELAKGKAGTNIDATKARIKDRLRRSRAGHSSIGKHQSFRSNMIRTVFLLALIVVIAIGVFTILNVYLPTWVGE